MPIKGRRVFFGSGILGGGNPWYLAGGVPSNNCIGAYKAIGAASLANSYINLIQPGTNNLTTVSAPDFLSTTGWTFDGTNALKYPGAIGNNYSMVFRHSNFGGNTIICGHAVGGGTAFAVQNAGGTRYFDNGNQVSYVEAATSGVVALTDYGYLDGVQKTSQMNGQGSSAAIGIGGNYTVGPNVIAAYIGDIQAISFYNILLSPTQVAAISTAMAALS